MRRASIDIGSNSVLLLAVELNEEGGIKNEILNESSITSLGKDLDVNKKFHSESMNLTYDTLKMYKELLGKINFPLSDVLVTATEASRVSTNSRDFFKKINEELGFNVQIISSEGEAYYTALGVASSLHNASGKIVVMDIGGASTELILINLDPFEIDKSTSLAVGSVRASDWKNKNEFDSKIFDVLSSDLSEYRTEVLVCVAGSMTALASMYLGQHEYNDKKIEGMTISFKTFQDFVRDLQNTTVENLLMLFPFLGKRVTSVSAGALVAEIIGNKLNIDLIKISTRGLRYGTVISGEIHERFFSK